MNIFFVLYCLSQACLGEINSNFRRIYIVFEDMDAVKLYFYLENYTEADNQNVYHEIMSMFEYYLDGDELHKNIKVSNEVIYGDDKKYITNEKNFIEFYRKQVDLENDGKSIT